MPVFDRTPGVLFDRLDERAVVIDARGTELITLNQAGRVVWEALDGRRDTEAIAQELRTRFSDTDPRRVGEDVKSFLSELERLNLVVAVGAEMGEDPGRRDGA